MQVGELTTKNAQQTTNTEKLQCENLAEIQKLKTANELSEQQMISVQFEYEQYKIRTKNREEELIQRLDDETVLQLRIQTDKYAKQLQDLELKHFNMEAQNQELLEKLNRMAIDRDDQVKLKNSETVQRQIDGLTNEIGQLQSELLSFNEINGQLEAKNREQQVKVDEAEKLVSLMTEQFHNDLKSAHNEIDQLKNEISDSEAMKCKLHNENRSLETTVRDNNALATHAEVNQLRDELKALRATNDQLTIVNAELSEKLDFSNVQQAEATNKADQIIKEMAATQALQSQLEAENQSLELKITNALTNCADVDHLHDKLEALRATNDQLTAANSELNEKLKSIYVQQDEATTKIHELMKEIADAQAIQSKMHDELKALRATGDQLSITNDELNEKLANVNVQQDETTRKANEMISNLKRDLKNTIESMNDKIAEHKSKAIIETQKYNQLETDYDELSNQVIDYLQEIDQLKQKIDELESVEMRQSENYRQLCEERTQLAEELEKLKTDHEIELNDLHRTVNAIDSRIHERNDSEARCDGVLPVEVTETDANEIGINTTLSLSREIAALEEELAIGESNQANNSMSQAETIDSLTKQESPAAEIVVSTSGELNNLLESTSLIDIDSGKISAMLTKIADLENASNDSAAIQASLQQEIADLEMALDAVNKMCASDQAKLVTLETEKACTNEALKAEQTKYAELLQELGAIKPFKIKCEILEISVRENEDKNTKFEIEIAELREKIHNLTNDLLSNEQKDKFEIEQLNGEYSKVRQNVINLQLSNDKLSETVAKQTAELTDIKTASTNTVADLRLQLDASEMIRQHLTDTLAGCQLNCKSDESKIDKLETELHHKTNQLMNSENIAKTLETKCTAQLDEIGRLQNDLIKSDAIVELNSKVIQQTENECKSMRSTFKELENNIESLQSENEQLRTHTSSLDRKIVELRSMVGELEECRRELEDELNDVRREHSKMETIEEQVSIEICAEKVTALEKDLEQSFGQRVALTREIDRLTNELEFGRELKRINAELKDELYVCKANLVKMCDDRKDFVQTIEGQRSELEKCAGSNTEIERLNQLLAHKQRSYDDNHKRVLNELKKTKELLNESKNDNAKLQTALATEKSKLLEQIDRNVTNEKRIDELTTEMLSKTRELAKLQTTDALLDKLTDQMYEMDRDRIRVVNEAKMVAKQGDALRAELVNLRHELTQVVGDKELFGKEANNLKNELRKMKTERSKMVGETEMLAKTVEELKEELVKMRIERNQIVDEQKVLVKQNADLRTELANIKKEHSTLNETKHHRR